MSDASVEARLSFRGEGEQSQCETETPRFAKTDLLSALEPGMSQSRNLHKNILLVLLRLMA